MMEEIVFAIERAGIRIEAIEYGARLRCCLVPDRTGKIADVVPGFDRAVDYVTRGGTMGGVLGRYGNRIGHGRINISGTDFALSRNDGDHTMHGGAGHFGTRTWRGSYDSAHAIVFELVSPDGDQGWPGTMHVRATYSLTERRELLIEMEAVCDHDTFVNMLFHGYWNLAGHDSGTVHGHFLKIAADQYTPKSPNGLPTGELVPVEGTPFDFRSAKRIGAEINAVGRGYAHNLCLREASPANIRPVAWLLDPSSGRALTLSADQPGVQVFTGNSWSKLLGKDGAEYNAHSALALETQMYPNTPNTPAFAPKLVRAGEVYRHCMIVAFHALEANQYAGFLEGR